MHEHIRSDKNMVSIETVDLKFYNRHMCVFINGVEKRMPINTFIARIIVLRLDSIFKKEINN